MDYMESIKKLEEKWMNNHSKHGTNGFINGSHGNDHVNKDVAELKIMLQKEITSRKRAEEEIQNLRNSQLPPTEVWIF